MPLDKSYDPRKTEARWYDIWEASGFFAPSGEGDAYCIMIPPPNVTGSLHMGHAFQDTIMDALTRYHRMQGRNTLWQPGMDHAGIATQMVVERLINSEGQSRSDYGRDRFVQRVWKWKEESGGMITRQLRRMGASLDWANERFTMDDGLSRAVKDVFIQLYDEGIIYRGKRLVNWDPVLHTALSDLEVLSVEEKGYLWHLKYPLVDMQGALIVATTRPETMLGDSAVAVHPQDDRYQHLIGKYCQLPLTGRQIPIIADEYADPEFGSGCVKITPAHDFNDYQIWLRHCDKAAMRKQVGGGLINIFTDDAAITDGQVVPVAYRGQDRFDARRQIVADFRAQGLLVKIDDHMLMIPRGDRSDAVIEPYLIDQWYVDLTRDRLEDGRPGGKAVLTDPAINAVRSGAIEFVPQSWCKTYYQWLENIEDWCISRQIWWGHRIPAWYSDDGDIYVGEDEIRVREKYGLPEDLALRQDDDVLDTWFSSALWPFSTLGWPQQTDRLAAFYPTSVLVTGFDIIFFWVARMIMMGTKFMGDVPFRQIYMHGLIRDSHGQKMSKSKGNVLDPIDLIDGIDLEALVAKRTSGMMQPHLREKIEKQTREDFPNGILAFGTDALRFTFAALASNGRDLNFDLSRTEGYRNFCNKIWNAARFVLLNVEGADGTHDRDSHRLCSADKWMVSQLQRSAGTVKNAIEKYRFDLAAQEIHDLVWNRYCDWYVEFAKVVLYDDNADATLKAGTRRTLVAVLEAIMRLIHPIMPYISEEIWQRVAELAGKRGDTIMTQPYPDPRLSLINEDAEQQMGWVMECILGIRKIRGEMGIAPGRRVPVLLDNVGAQERIWLDQAGRYLCVAGRAESLYILENGDEAPESSVAMIGAVKLLIPLAGLIDKEAETARINKLIVNAKIQAEHLRNKLSNAGFVHNAPEEIVAKERGRLAEIETTLQGWHTQLQRLQRL